MPKSTRSTGGGKPAKPRDDFPSSSMRAADGQRGSAAISTTSAKSPRAHTREKALNKWLDEKDDQLAGRTPRPNSEGLALAGLCNAFLTHKLRLLESGELAQRTFDRYKAATDFLIETFGSKASVESFRPADFEALRAKMTKRWGAIALGNEIQIVRSVFRYGVEAELIDKAIRFGPGFKKPSAKTIRQTRAADGPRDLAPKAIKSLLAKAGPNLKAMILLAVNGGLGNTEEILEMAGLRVKEKQQKGRRRDHRRESAILARIEQKVLFWTSVLRCFFSKVCPETFAAQWRNSCLANARDCRNRASLESRDSDAWISSAVWKRTSPGSIAVGRCVCGQDPGLERSGTSADGSQRRERVQSALLG